VHVGDEVRLGRQQLVPLGVRLHEAVLDAVVDHLGVVTGTDAARVDEALLTGALRAQRVEDRHDRLDVGGSASDHQAVAVLQPPDSTAHTDVEVADAVLGELGGTLLVLDVVRVAALDHDVALAEDLGELVEHTARRLTGGNHDPDDPLVLREGGRQVCERRDVRDLRTRVEPGDLDTALAQAGPHVVAHLAQADQADVGDHVRDSSRVDRRARSWRPSLVQAGCPD
jgi:hypothetical protein